MGGKESVEKLETPERALLIRGDYGLADPLTATVDISLIKNILRRLDAGDEVLIDFARDEQWVLVNMGVPLKLNAGDKESLKRVTMTGVIESRMSVITYSRESDAWHFGPLGKGTSEDSIILKAPEIFRNKGVSPKLLTIITPHQSDFNQAQNLLAQGQETELLYVGPSEMMVPHSFEGKFKISRGIFHSGTNAILASLR